MIEIKKTIKYFYRSEGGDMAVKLQNPENFPQAAKLVQFLDLRG